MSPIAVRSSDLLARARAERIASDRKGLLRISHADLRRLVVGILEAETRGLRISPPQPAATPFEDAQLQDAFLRRCLGSLGPVRVVLDPRDGFPSETASSLRVDWQQLLTRTCSFSLLPSALLLECPTAGGAERAAGDLRGAILLREWFALADAWALAAAGERALAEREVQLVRTLEEARRHHAQCTAELEEDRRAPCPGESLTEKTGRRKRTQTLEERLAQAERTLHRLEGGLSHWQDTRRSGECWAQVRACSTRLIARAAGAAAWVDLLPRIAAACDRLGPAPVSAPVVVGEPVPAPTEAEDARLACVEWFRAGQRHEWRLVQDPDTILLERRRSGARRMTRAATLWLAGGGCVVAGALAWRGTRERPPDAAPAAARPLAAPIEPSPVVCRTAAEVEVVDLSQPEAEICDYPSGHTTMVQGQIEMPPPRFHPVTPADLRVPLRRPPVGLIAADIHGAPDIDTMYVAWLDPGLCPMLAARYRSLVFEFVGTGARVDLDPRAPDAGQGFTLGKGRRHEDYEQRLTGVTAAGATEVIYRGAFREGAAGHLIRAFPPAVHHEGPVAAAPSRNLAEAFSVEFVGEGSDSQGVSGPLWSVRNAAPASELMSRWSCRSVVLVLRVGGREEARRIVDLAMLADEEAKGRRTRLLMYPASPLDPPFDFELEVLTGQGARLGSVPLRATADRQERR